MNKALIMRYRGRQSGSLTVISVSSKKYCPKYKEKRLYLVLKCTCGYIFYRTLNDFEAGIIVCKKCLDKKPLTEESYNLINCNYLYVKHLVERYHKEDFDYDTVESDAIDFLIKKARSYSLEDQISFRKYLRISVMKMRAKKRPPIAARKFPQRNHEICVDCMELVSFLSPLEQFVINNYYFQSKTFKEIAREIGYTGTGIGNIVSRSLIKLKRLCEATN